jgi:hypothetical protein
MLPVPFTVVISVLARRDQRRLHLLTTEELFQFRDRRRHRGLTPLLVD